MPIRVNPRLLVELGNPLSKQLNMENELYNSLKAMALRIEGRIQMLDSHAMGYRELGLLEWEYSSRLKESQLRFVLKELNEILLKYEEGTKRGSDELNS